MLRALAALIRLPRRGGGIHRDAASHGIQHKVLHQTPSDRIDCEMERIKSVLGDIERGNAMAELTARSDGS